jgi:hypothetical protein
MVPQTTYIPYSEDRFDQLALFFAPLIPPCAGIYERELSNEDKQLIGSNKAIRVFAVRRGSAAYLADIIPGDIVLNTDVLDSMRRGVASEVRIKRGDKDITLSVTGGDGCPT